MNSIVEEYKSHLKVLAENLKRELQGVRTNRPHPGLVEDIKVDYYGQSLPVKQLGSVSVAPPREIQVHVWDAAAAAAVAKALAGAGAGFSVSGDGNIVRVHLPELSEERRKELVRYAGKLAEETRIKVRRERDEWNKKIQKLADSGELSEDQKFKHKEGVQKVTEETGKEIESALAAKVKEVEA
ncbi:MAG: ribosome-recycling factor [Candidatus Jorgensenbacteria bacterium]